QFFRLSSQRWPYCSKPPLLHVVTTLTQLLSMMIQLVPSLTSFANFPAVAARIAVPGVAESDGHTFEVAETTVCAWIVLMTYTLPTLAPLAAGNVSVMVPALLAMRYVS